MNKSVLIYLCIFGFFGFFYLIENRKEKRLLKEYGIVNTVVDSYDYSLGSKSGSRADLKDKYVVGDSVFNKEYRVFLRINSAGNMFLNKSFSVVYSKEDPSYSFLLLREKDFSKINKSFPDSILWTKKYIE